MVDIAVETHCLTLILGQAPLISGRYIPQIELVPKLNTICTRLIYICIHVSLYCFLQSDVECVCVCVCTQLGISNWTRIQISDFLNPDNVYIFFIRSFQTV